MKQEPDTPPPLALITALRAALSYAPSDELGLLIAHTLLAVIKAGADEPSADFPKRNRK